MTSMVMNVTSTLPDNKNTPKDNKSTSLLSFFHLSYFFFTKNPL